MHTDPGDAVLQNHFTVAIYPFLFDATPDGLAGRAHDLAARWRPYWARLNKEEKETALDDTYFFLPYVRDILFPETIRLRDEGPPGIDYETWARSLTGRAEDPARWLLEHLTSQQVVRLACMGDLPFAPATEHRDGISTPFPVHFTVLEAQDDAEPQGKSEPLRASLEWVDALLFPSGIGFLILKARLMGKSPRLSQLIELNDCLQVVHPPTRSWRLPRLQFSGHGSGLTLGKLIEEILGAGANRLVDAPKDVRYTETEAGQVYGERCQILSYACVDLASARGAELPVGSFARAEDRLLFEYAYGIALGDSVRDRTWAPSAEEASRLSRENRISVWDCWRGMALKESAVFLATEAIGFTSGALPHNIESDYLPLYLYTLYQRTQLFVFSNDLMRKGADIEKNRREMRELRDRFIRFRNQYWFNEVTMKPLGSELYRKFQQSLSVPALYDLVSDEAKDIQEYYEERHGERINLILNGLAFVILPLNALFALFSMQFVHGSWIWFVRAAVLTIVAVVIFAWAVLQRGRHAARRGRAARFWRAPRRRPDAAASGPEPTIEPVHPTA